MVAPCFLSRASKNGVDSQKAEFIQMNTANLAQQFQQKKHSPAALRRPAPEEWRVEAPGCGTAASRPDSHRTHQRILSPGSWSREADPATRPLTTTKTEAAAVLADVS